MTEADHSTLDPRPTAQYADLQQTEPQYAEPQQAAVRPELAEEIGLAMAGSLNLRRSVLQLLDGVRPEVADWTVVAFPSSHGIGLQLFGGDDVSAVRSVSRRRVARSALERVLSTGRRELLHVAAGVEDSLAALIPHADLRAEAAALRPADVLAIGLTARGVTLGALILVRGQGRGFTPDDIAQAERIAVRASLALDSARLYEQRGEIASALQDSLVPPPLPDVPGVALGARYRPSAEQLDIGGDFYDVFRAGDDWLVALGDVCGKGVHAAVLTGRARQSLRTAALFERDPGALLAALSTVFHDDTSERFITLLCLRVRTTAENDDLIVEIASAGHVAPLLVRADGEVTSVEVEGAVLGVVGDAEYDTTTVRLAPGDQLVLSTDGVDEARGDSGFYGSERLIALLSELAGAAPDVVCAAVEQDVVEHLAGRAHDDIAVLSVGCPGRAS
ncbi:SpoIIE family protein phosphatase [Kribbella sp. NPDC048915]|uniref:PP2C family protein-serine/threonine phosphatase n=1 Tax=Kribbella sp. NPDC048915 TaxID=3155148 RepID=UPI0033E91D3A